MYGLQRLAEYRAGLKTEQDEPDCAEVCPERRLPGTSRKQADEAPVFLLQPHAP